MEEFIAVLRAAGYTVVEVCTLDNIEETGLLLSITKDNTTRTVAVTEFAERTAADKASFTVEPRIS